VTLLQITITLRASEREYNSKQDVSSKQVDNSEQEYDSKQDVSSKQVDDSEEDDDNI
jgi:hypothetical protein